VTDIKISLRFLFDPGVGKLAEQILIEMGFDVISMWDIDPKMKDIDILKLALNTNRIVITMDKDFGELIFNANASHAGVLLLRLDEADGTQKAEIVKEIILKHGNNLEGHFAVFQNGKLRIRI
jgi:predicted nuclease of predicted toxin-antitoxin system